MPKPDFTEYEQKALNVIENGNALTKVFKRQTDDFLQFITEFLKNPQSVKQKLKNPSTATTREHAIGLSVDKTSQLVIKNVNDYAFESVKVATRKKPDSFTKSTSTTLLSKSGKAALFVGAMPGEAGISSADSYQIGLLFDFYKTKPAKFAFFKSDGFTSLKPWRLRDTGTYFHRIAEFIHNLLPSFEATKAFVEQSSTSSGGYPMTEVYTRVSKESLQGITIRSVAYFKNPETRMVSIAEKIKMEKALNREGLPIIVLNDPDPDKGATPYTFAEQQEDFKTYLEKLNEQGTNPNQHFQDQFGITLQTISDHLSQVRPVKNKNGNKETAFETQPGSDIASENLEQPFLKTPQGIFIIALIAFIVILAIILTALFLTHVITLPTLAASALTATLTTGISGTIGSNLGLIIVSTLITALFGGIYFLNKSFNSVDSQTIDTFNAGKNQDSYPAEQEERQTIL